MNGLVVTILRQSNSKVCVIRTRSNHAWQTIEKEGVGAEEDSCNVWITQFSKLKRSVVY